MQSWRGLNITVDELHHWPGENNIADLPTRGKVSFTDVGPDSEWQLGPEVTRKPRSQCPASRQFMRGVPQEETRPKLYTTNLVTISSLLTSSLNLHSLVNEIINSYSKFLTITARWIAAKKMQDREKVTTEPSVYYLTLAKNLAFIRILKRYDTSYFEHV